MAFFIDSPPGIFQKAGVSDKLLLLNLENLLCRGIELHDAPFPVLEHGTLAHFVKEYPQLKLMLPELQFSCFPFMDVG
jgi:hypothetical protein